MTNELKVLYKDEKGLLVYDKKIIFQHRENREGVEAGIGVIKRGTLDDRGNYAFAEFENVLTVLPECYTDIAFFENRGVPSKIEEGLYNGYVVIRETYMDRIYIRAYKPDGSVGLYESENIKNATYSGPNVYFTRLSEAVDSWVDITDSVLVGLKESVKSLQCVVPITDSVVQTALRGLKGNKISKLGSGVIVADGRFESLIIWSEGKAVKMAWLGRKFDLSGIDYIDASNMVD